MSCMLPLPYSEDVLPATWLAIEAEVAMQIAALTDHTDHGRACVARQIVAQVLRRFRPDLIDGTDFQEKVQMVCQEGGSTGEYYAAGYDTVAEAQAFIDNCMHEGAYNCIGPYEIEVRKIGGVDFIKAEDACELLATACGDAAANNYAEYSPKPEEKYPGSIDKCGKCGAETLHDKESAPANLQSLHQGGTCHCCDRVICPDCVGDKTVGPHNKTLCKECSSADTVKPNTTIHYMYRDGGNFKESEIIVVAGRISRDEIKDCLDEGQYFIAHDVGLPELQSRMVNFPTPDTDHVWHELHEFEPTDEVPTTTITAEQMREAFLKHKGDWNDDAATERLGLGVTDEEEDCEV